MGHAASDLDADGPAAAAAAAHPQLSQAQVNAADDAIAGIRGEDLLKAIPKTKQGRRDHRRLGVVRYARLNRVRGIRDALVEEMRIENLAAGKAPGVAELANIVRAKNHAAAEATRAKAREEAEAQRAAEKAARRAARGDDYVSSSDEDEIDTAGEGDDAEEDDNVPEPDFTLVDSLCDTLLQIVDDAREDETELHTDKELAALVNLMTNAMDRIQEGRRAMHKARLQRDGVSLHGLRTPEEEKQAQEHGLAILSSGSDDDSSDSEEDLYALVAETQPNSNRGGGKNGGRRHGGGRGRNRRGGRNKPKGRPKRGSGRRRGGVSRRKGGRKRGAGGGGGRSSSSSSSGSSSSEDSAGGEDPMAGVVQVASRAVHRTANGSRLSKKPLIYGPVAACFPMATQVCRACCVFLSEVGKITRSAPGETERWAGMRDALKTSRVVVALARLLRENGDSNELTFWGLNALYFCCRDGAHVDEENVQHFRDAGGVELIEQLSRRRRRAAARKDPLLSVHLQVSLFMCITCNLASVELCILFIKRPAHAIALTFVQLVRTMLLPTRTTQDLMALLGDDELDGPSISLADGAARVREVGGGFGRRQAQAILDDY